MPAASAPPPFAHDQAHASMRTVWGRVYFEYSNLCIWCEVDNYSKSGDHKFAHWVMNECQGEWLCAFKNQWLCARNFNDCVPTWMIVCRSKSLCFLTGTQSFTSAHNHWSCKHTIIDFWQHTIIQPGTHSSLNVRTYGHRSFSYTQFISAPPNTRKGAVFFVSHPPPVSFWTEKKRTFYFLTGACLFWQLQFERNIVIIELKESH